MNETMCFVQSQTAEVLLNWLAAFAGEGPLLGGAGSWGQVNDCNGWLRTG